MLKFARSADQFPFSFAKLLFLPIETETQLNEEETSNSTITTRRKEKSFIMHPYYYPWAYENATHFDRVMTNDYLMEFVKAKNIKYVMCVVWCDGLSNISIYFSIVSW